VKKKKRKGEGQEKEKKLRHNHKREGGEEGKEKIGKKSNQNMRETRARGITR